MSCLVGVSLFAWGLVPGPSNNIIYDGGFWWTEWYQFSLRSDWRLVVSHVSSMWSGPKWISGHWGLSELPWVAIFCVCCHTTWPRGGSIVQDSWGEDTWRLTFGFLPGSAQCVSSLAIFNLYPFPVIKHNRSIIVTSGFCQSFSWIIRIESGFGNPLGLEFVSEVRAAVVCGLFPNCIWPTFSQMETGRIESGS